MNLTIHDATGKKVGSYEIDPAEIAPKISKQLLHEAVVMYQANLRQGTQKTKTRGEVAGSTKKLYRQKGTGNARAGGRRSGVRRGGGHIFAKNPRDFGFRLPRRSLQVAARMAFAARLADGEIKLIDSLLFSKPQTAVMAKVLAALDLGGRTVLVSTETHNDNLWKSARNITGISVAPVGDLNALTILTPYKILMTTAAIDSFRQKAAAEVASKGLKDAKKSRTSGKPIQAKPKPKVKAESRSKPVKPKADSKKSIARAAAKTGKDS